MEKGQIGIRLSFYAVAAFLFAMVGSSTLTLLVAGAAIIIEKNVWLTRQVIQAVMLGFFPSFISLFVGWLMFLGRIPGVYTAMSWIDAIVTLGTSITVFVFGILAIGRLKNGGEAKVPVAAGIANWACGITMMK